MDSELVFASNGSDWNDSQSDFHYWDLTSASKLNTDVAVKVFDLQNQNAFKSFDVECEVLRNLRHQNLCKVISTCSNQDFKASVLEYMSNGSLEKWLYPDDCLLDIL
ncbi:Protein kinase domain-containing protein [Forsythia ovata]|uniref:Protein kinase domain-containing protein n=1 Tax=Forsythia ovata TaxID=205694 RepID=A0ABD1SL47_9LAMI